MALYVRAKCRKCRTDQDVRIPKGADNIFRAPCSNCHQDMQISIVKIEAVVLKPKTNGNGGGQ